MAAVELVNEEDVEASSAEGDTARTRITFAPTGRRLEQRVVRFGRGRSRERGDAERHEVLYVASGSGRLLLEAREYELAPDTGAFVAAGETYTVENPGGEDIVAVSVLAPAELAPDDERRRVTVRFVDQPPHPASPNREFRYLVNEEVGCRDVTQFVGLIPPGYAGMHSHTYDEVIYVVDGEGVLHVDGTSRPLRRGSCIHLPPLREHCLENTGTHTLRVLGVFHPSGDPASRASEELQT